MSEQAFVIGDVHGCQSQLKQLLKSWNPDSQKLFFIGDLLDRGEDSLGVVQLAMKLQKEYGATILGGNHEEMFLEWLSAPMNHASYYFPRGGAATLASFMGIEKDEVDIIKSTEISKRIQEDFQEEIAFIKSLPDYVEHNDHYVFVHAGINPRLSDWRESGSMYFRSIRDGFYNEENHTGKIIVFGHTPTRRINSDKSDDIWISSCNTKINIDGGAIFGGLLHGLLIRESEDYQLFSVDSELSTNEKRIIV